VQPERLVLGIVLYLAVAWGILRVLRGPLREAAFALWNIGAVYFFFVKIHDRYTVELFIIYLAAVIAMYGVMHALAEKSGWKHGLAFFAPILVLIIVRYVPGLDALLTGTLIKGPLDSSNTLAGVLVGLSYLAFRCSYLVIEVRNGQVTKPGFWEYMGFSFFAPTMPVGPINSYANYRRGFAPNAPVFPVGRSLLRILVGLVKYLVLGNLFNQLSYSGLLLDDHYHSWTDLPIAAIFFYLYLYLNFSGFCDIAIGGAGLIGIPVPENFNYPLAARNIKDFWNRWHMTLSGYMRDVVFSPLSKYLGYRFGPHNVNLAIAITIMVVFVLIGIWHGTGWNYAAFGVMQGIGVVGNLYYTVALKKWLGRDGMRAYNANQWIHAVAVMMTFLYMAFSLFIFGNAPADMKEILSEIRW
jgi:D-alanyl-lipoteichoic acid acyltransferase DltB (MBOAT superfamily)